MGGCVEDPKLGGGMGIHYLHPKRVDNPKLAGDKTLIPEEPELLLYAPDKNGKLKLIGVEYMVSKVQWIALGNNPKTSRPEIFGFEFEGLMAPHGPGEPE